MSAQLSTSEWTKVADLAGSDSAHAFGLPRRRNKSVVLGTFNIRKLGSVAGRSAGAWEFLRLICARFDLLAIQEVMDDLDGIKHLKDSLGKNFGMAVSDVTGTFPGDSGNPERLAFLFQWKRISRTQLASDITYDRSKVVNTLFEHRADFSAAWDNHVKRLRAWKKKCQAAEAAGKRKPGKPQTILPRFLTFIRQPHCASFQVLDKNGAKPIDLLVVNAHLLYGEDPNERKWEFDALIEWLTIRAKRADRLYHKNILMMGDCNLEFEQANIKRQDIDEALKRINKEKLKSKKAAKVNFPLLDAHPTHGVLTTSIRQEQTYDQIALFAHDQRLPDYQANRTAGATADGYDYGVFCFSDLIAEALHGKHYAALSQSQRKAILRKIEYDISDHMPAWIRLPIPGA